MTGRCKVCCHVARERIESEIMAGRSLAEISRSFQGISEDSLSRHHLRHMAPVVDVGQTGRAALVNGGAGLVSLLRDLHELSGRALALAEASAGGPWPGDITLTQPTGGEALPSDSIPTAAEISPPQIVQPAPAPAPAKSPREIEEERRRESFQEDWRRVNAGCGRNVAVLYKGDGTL